MKAAKMRSAPIRAVRLQLWLPLLLALVTLSLMAAFFVVQKRDTQARLQYFADQTAREMLLTTQLNLEAALRPGRGRSLDSVISTLGLSSDVEYAALLDDAGRVLAATRFAWKQQQAADVVPHFPKESIDRLPQQSGLDLQVDLRSKRLLAVAPVNMPPQAGQVRAQRLGTLLIVYDLAPRMATVEGLMWQRLAVMSALLMVAVVLLYFFARWAILRPIMALRSGLEKIGEGHLDSLPVIVGHGEFFRLGKAMQKMAEALRARDTALRESEGRFRQLAEGAFEAVLVHENGIILNANPAAERLWSAAAGELIGKPLLSMIAPHHREVVVARTQQKLVGVWLVDVIDSKGTIIPTEVSVRHHQTDDHPMRVVSLRDMRERYAIEAEVERLTNVDSVTGLANRRALMERVTEEIESVSENDHRAALVVLDIDGFKTVNDSLGMALGDGVLRAVARRLNERLAKGQLLARVDADTFALLMTGLKQATLQDASAYVGRKVEALLFALAEPLQVQGHEHTLHLTASAGVVLIPNDVGDAPELLREAETAMHLAKQEGGGRLHFFAHALQEAAKGRLKLRMDMRNVLHSDLDQLVLHYQPQVAANGRHLLGVEALVRWQHPQRGLVAPNDFIPEAEASGLIVPLGYHVMEQAVTCLQRLRACAVSQTWAAPMSMAVNVSPRQFRERDFIPRVEDLLARTGMDAFSLELELTESVLAEDLEATLEKMAHLRKLGVHFALDDFGTGYSSLSYLKRLPIETLKIDRSFVMDIDADGDENDRRRPAALIGAIVTLAHQFDLRVLAEGVETTTQRDKLMRAGCDSFQGYLFSKPLPEEALCSWAKAFTAAGE